MTTLIEIFSSIQGEGPYVGVRQVFLRFAGCNLSCAYCDTGYTGTDTFRVEDNPGTGRFSTCQNPVDAGTVAGIVSGFGLPKTHSLSLTGGEPLIHTGFITELAGLLRIPKGLRFYLETNGTLTEELVKVISNLDIISMDIKLPSVTGRSTDWDTHREFLAVARQQEVFVKVVVAGQTTTEEIAAACQVVSAVDRQIPLVIQPLSPHRNFSGEAPKPLRLLEFQELALDHLSNVRVIPQTHKILGQL